MASQHAILVVAALVALPSVALAMQWTIGDDSGWTINFDYDAWARGKVFRVGDTLVFKYPAGNHNVFKVNGTDFRACNLPSANEALRTGNDVIALKTPRNKCNICGVGENCASFDQKLKITVVGADGQATTLSTPVTRAKNSGARTVVPSGFMILAAAVVALVLLVI